MEKYYPVLLEHIDSLDVFDTHEHLEPSSIRASKKIDIFNVLFNQYITDDLISAGMKEFDCKLLIDEESELEVKWNVLAPFLDDVRNTGYYRVIQIVLKDLFGIEELEESTYRVANERLKQHSKPGLYDRLLVERCRIRYCILDKLPPNEEFDHQEPYMRSTFRPHDFQLKKRRSSIVKMEKKTGLEKSSLSLFTDAMRRAAYTAKSKGAITLKNSMAYNRKILFMEVERTTADKLYSRLYAGDELTDAEITQLQDYLTHETVSAAQELGLPIQIHTGLQSGNGNYITNSNPVLLANLFMKYPEVKFDVFHGGYPYGSELATLAKNFPNVYANQCWLHAISPVVARNYLNEWLDTVPSNKIFGFGGDSVSVEQIYGHLKLAKDNIARVLANKVEDGSMTLAYAKTIANRILYYNPARFYGFE